MKRRSFLAGIAAALGASALHLPALAEIAAPAAPDLPIGYAMPFIGSNGKMAYTVYAGGGRFIEAAGQLVSRTEYPELFSLLNTMFGHNVPPDDTFGLPTLNADTLNWVEGAGDVWNNSMLPMLSKEPGPTYEPDEPYEPLFAAVEPHRDKMVDDGLGPNRAAGGKFWQDGEETWYREPDWA